MILPYVVARPFKLLACLTIPVETLAAQKMVSCLGLRPKIVVHFVSGNLTVAASGGGAFNPEG